MESADRMVPTANERGCSAVSHQAPDCALYAREWVCPGSRHVCAGLRRVHCGTDRGGAKGGEEQVTTRRPNRAPAPNRRPCFPFGGSAQFEYISCAPPSSS